MSTDSKGLAASMGSGAAMGAAIGSVVPVVGTLFGALGGAVFGQICYGFSVADWRDADEKKKTGDEYDGGCY